MKERKQILSKGGMLESKNGAHNVTSLDGFVSLGKSSVTKNEF